MIGTQLDLRPCVCGHPAEAHSHHRPGRDCGTCGPIGCPRFRRLGPGRRAAARLLDVVFVVRLAWSWWRTFGRPEGAR